MAQLGYATKVQTACTTILTPKMPNGERTMEILSTAK